MRVETKLFSDSSEIKAFSSSFLGEKADLVFYFGNREQLSEGHVYKFLQETYPHSIVLGCSTGGEIAFDEVHEGSVVSLAIDFEKTEIKQASIKISKPDDSYNAGKDIGKRLHARDLKGIFVLSDG